MLRADPALDQNTGTIPQMVGLPYSAVSTVDAPRESKALGERSGEASARSQPAGASSPDVARHSGWNGEQRCR